MNEPKFSGDFLKRLLEQDSQIDVACLDEQRQRILRQLREAEPKEKRARKIAALVAGIAGAVALGLQVSVPIAFANVDPEKLPAWLVITVAMILILLSTSSVLLGAIYLFRYRRPLLRLRKDASQQTLLVYVRQIDELRKSLEELKKAPDRSKGGFTLTEMLVSISILGILTSLLLPALSGAKARARTAVCRSNLAQIGRALMMYEADYHYFPGAGDAGIHDGMNIPWALPSTNSWVARIRSFVASSEAVFLCPEYKAPDVSPTIKIDSFGYNAGGSAGIWKHMETNLGLGYGKSNFVALGEIKAPSEMIAIGDQQLPGSVWCNIITPSWERIGGLLTVPSRHGGGADMLFVDSHVELRKQSKWIAKKDVARAVWNNDHRPHPETW